MLILLCLYSKKQQLPRQQKLRRHCALKLELKLLLCNLAFRLTSCNNGYGIKLPRTPNPQALQISSSPHLKVLTAQWGKVRRGAIQVAELNCPSKLSIYMCVRESVCVSVTQLPWCTLLPGCCMTDNSGALQVQIISQQK